MQRQMQYGFEARPVLGAEAGRVAHAGLLASGGGMHGCGTATPGPLLRAGPAGRLAGSDVDAEIGGDAGQSGGVALADCAKLRA